MARGCLLVALAALVGVACVTPTPYGDNGTSSGQKTSSKGDDDDDTTGSSTSSSGGPTFLDSGSSPDGSHVGQSCNQTAPFGAPVLIPEVSDPNISDWAVTLTGDELTMIINRGDDDEMLAAKRTSISAAFGAPSSLEAGFYDPVLSNDGTIFLSASQGVGTLFQQARNVTSGELGSATQMTLNGFSEAQWDNPSLSIDGTTLCWGNEPTNTTSYHVMCATKTGTTLANVTKFASLEAFGDCFGPTFSPDRLTLYFSHGDPDGGEHIYEATRTSTSDDFGTPVARTELNAGSGSHEAAKFISADACRLYLVSTPATGNYDVFVATRPPG